MDGHHVARNSADERPSEKRGQTISQKEIEKGSQEGISSSSSDGSSIDCARVEHHYSAPRNRSRTVKVKVKVEVKVKVHVE